MRKKHFFLLAFLLCSGHLSFSQTDTIKGDAAKALFRQLHMDTTKFLISATDAACKCIDSIELYGKSNKEISTEITACIDKQVNGYQLAMKIYHSMADAGNNKIVLDVSKNSDEYKTCYYAIERMLNDSCTSLKKAEASDNKESANSVSSDKVAVSYYDKGIEEYNKDNYKDALPWFEKAVKQDDNFAFAWDNIGICKRHLGDLDGALIAYNKSLQLDPRGKVPLENIPVVYEYQKEYDKAIEAYKKLSNIYPDDPEAYYGTGRMYEMKGDLEKALDYMCKAYKAYIAINSPYRSDAEKNINIYYKKLKDLGKEDRFLAILKDNNISTK